MRAVPPAFGVFRSRSGAGGAVLAQSGGRAAPVGRGPGVGDPLFARVAVRGDRGDPRCDQRRGGGPDRIAGAGEPAHDLGGGLRSRGRADPERGEVRTRGGSAGRGALEEAAPGPLLEQFRGVLGRGVRRAAAAHLRRGRGPRGDADGRGRHPAAVRIGRGRASLPSGIRAERHGSIHAASFGQPICLSDGQLFMRGIERTKVLRRKTRLRCRLR